MIFDQLENLVRYRGIHKNIDTAIDYLLSHDVSNLNSGRYEVDGDRVFFFLQENTLSQQQEESFEFHQRYLDLHFLLEGRELIQYGCQIREVQEAYDEGRDIGFVVCEQTYPLLLVDFNFAAFLPEEAHQPNHLLAEKRQLKSVYLKFCWINI